MNIIDILRLDLEDIEKEFIQAASVLGKFGLSEYESRAYVALILKNHGTAEEVSELAMIPRTSAYKALQLLIQKKYVEETPGRPTIYHPIAVEEIQNRLVNEINETFNKLISVKGLLSEKGIPELVYTISGKKKVLTKIGEMLDSSKRTFLISSPRMQEIRSEHASRFKEALMRGVEITVVTEPLVKVPPSTEVHRRKDMIATDVIADGARAMIASADLTLCGYSDNPMIAGHLENFLRMIISRKES